MSSALAIINGYGYELIDTLHGHHPSAHNLDGKWRLCCVSLEGDRSFRGTMNWFKGLRAIPAPISGAGASQEYDGWQNMYGRTESWKLL